MIDTRQPTDKGEGRLKGDAGSGRGESAKAPNCARTGVSGH